MKAGVPQGSILGPLIFLKYINDIVRRINSSIRLFTDDASFYIAVENACHLLSFILTSLQYMNGHPNGISLLTLIKLNVLFSRNINTPVHPPLYMNHQLINEVTNHKHFDLILSNNFSWHEHLA